MVLSLTTVPINYCSYRIQQNKSHYLVVILELCVCSLSSRSSKDFKWERVLLPSTGHVFPIIHPHSKDETPESHDLHHFLTFKQLCCSPFTTVCSLGLVKSHFAVSAKPLNLLNIFGNVTWLHFTLPRTHVRHRPIT